MGNGVTFHLKCAENLPPRRYLVFQIPRHEILNVCEVQVYPRRMYIVHLLLASNTWSADSLVSFVDFVPDFCRPCLHFLQVIFGPILQQKTAIKMWT